MSTLTAPRVLNKRTDQIPTDAIYIGRPSDWGNPFTHLTRGTLAKFQVATRGEAVARYRAYLHDERPDLLARLSELRGRDLVCWCSPQACHGHILLELANAQEVQ